MKKTLHLMTQLLALAIFFVLIFNNKVQLWVGLFLLGIVISLFLGRIYCGWVCPINTTMNGILWIKKKLHIGNISTPTFISKPWVRFVVLGLFVAAFIFSMVSGARVPIFPALFILGILLTLFFSEELWHCYLCPFGIILSYSSAKSLHGVTVDTEKCNNCGACSRVCPAKAVVKKEKHDITKNKCLVCMACAENCNQDAISYK